MCQDYDGTDKTAQQFYQRTQAKLVYAVTSHTPSEIVAGRSDHSSDNMGLNTWPNENIRKADVIVAKNYLAEAEIKELNRLTTILLDIFEDQADVGRLLVMDDASQLLDRQLKSLGRSVLQSGGKIKSQTAKLRAQGQYDIFSERQKTERQLKAKENISRLAKEAKALNRRK